MKKESRFLNKEHMKQQKKSRNNYLVMRHGQGVTNLLHIVSRDGPYPLTPEGRLQAGETARRLAQKEKIDIIVTSPVPRAKETAEIVAVHTGISKIDIEPRFTEINFGIFEGKSVDEWKAFFSSRAERLIKPIPAGESFTELRQRMIAGLMDIEKKYKDKTILIVSHDDPLWVLYTTASCLKRKEALTLYMSKSPRTEMFLDFAQAVKMPYRI